MMFRGMLLPRHFTAHDLEDVEGNARVRGLLNPYYYDFLTRCDDTPRNNANGDGFGCFYARYFKCRNLDREGCRHRELVAGKEVDVCG